MIRLLVMEKGEQDRIIGHGLEAVLDPSWP